MKILLGVSGGIAAYKAAHLVRLMVKDGHEVKVVMSENSTDFITPLTLATLSRHPVSRDLFDSHTGEWTNHVHLAEWADVMVVAPATAHTIGKMAHGLCDNLLLAVYLSARCPVVVAPAMDLEMYQHPSFKENLARLSQHGVHILPAGTGELASGLHGEGRMAEPEEILTAVKKKASLRDAAHLTESISY